MIRISHELPLVLKERLPQEYDAAMSAIADRAAVKQTPASVEHHVEGFAAPGSALNILGEVSPPVVASESPGA